jgi:hypothetical protein
MTAAAVLFTHQGACDVLPIASLRKLDAQWRYEMIVDVCLALALDVLEYNCLVALVDHAATGSLAQCARMHVTVEGYSSAPQPPPLGGTTAVAAWRSFEDAFVPPYQPFAAGAHDGASAVRERLSGARFEPGALLRRHMPAWFHDAWMSELRTRYVAVKAMSRAWNLPQTRIRLALRRMHGVGLVDECSDYFCLDPRTVAMRLVACGLFPEGVTRAFAATTAAACEA